MSIESARGGLRLAVLTILMFVVPTSTLVAQSGEMPITASKDALSLFNQGREKIENLEDPGTLFRQAVEKDPNFAIAYLYVGNTNREFLESVGKAAALAEKVTPGERALIFATKAQAEGDQAAWEKNLKELMRIHPRDKRVQVLMGSYYRSLGDDAMSLKYFNEATKIDRNYAPAYNDIGYANLSMGKFAEAETAFKNYVRLIPKNPNPYDSYAELLMRMGRYDESIAQYRKALETDPTFFNSYRGIGNNYGYKGDQAKARESYQMMYDKAPNDGGRDLALLSMMNSYVAEGQIDKAMEISDRRIQLAQKANDPQQLIGVHTLSGLVLAESGRHDDAAKHFAEADKLRDDPSLPESLKANLRFGKIINQARMAIARDQLDAAARQLDEARQYLSTREDPNRRRTLNFMAGMLELKRKNYAKAAELFSSSDQSDPYVMYYTALAYDGAGNAKSAAEMYKKINDWNQLDAAGHAIVRARASARGPQLATAPKAKN